MPLINKYYSLKNVRITLNSGVVADAIQIDIVRTWETADRTAGSAGTEQTVIVKEKRPKITIKGWNGDTTHFATLVPWTALTAFTVLSTETGTPSVLPADFLTKWPVSGMCLGDTKTSYSEKPSDWETEVLAGVLNPNGL